MLLALLLALAAPFASASPAKTDTAPLTFAEGGWWDYEVKRGTIAARSRQRPGGLEDLDGKPAFYFESEEGPNRVRTYYVASKEGVLLAGVQTASSGGVGSRNRTLFQPPSLTYPRKWKVGRKWATSTRGRGKADIIAGGQASSAILISLEGKHRIAAREKIKVPAGEFDCFLIETEAVGTTLWESGPFDGSRHETRGVEKTWFSPELGQVVQSETRGLSAFMDPSGAISRSEERVDRVLLDYKGR